ncbi:SDR family oxidoreductase [uncultured Microbulbifer sp.]|uniref:SDR family oxidoreductase n=1 Tax=uncultured Microbulbifer sp. TaxID=348147 RepID=UPI0026141CFC|nr:SDR family oxidoreductase [uncultured Microbulbifer sp.]
MEQRILITGALGYIGHQLGERLSKTLPVFGIDIRSKAASFPVYVMDICDKALGALMQSKSITHVIHLASVMSAGRDQAAEYRIDVEGTRNVLDACLYAGVEHITVSSSGAAYGYYPDNPSKLDEHHPLRGNPEFGYSYNKRQVEALLAEYCEKYPHLKQLIFRVSSVLGAKTNNKISALFSQQVILDPGGHNSPFVFVWDQDVIRAISFGVNTNAGGIFNLAGDGRVSPREIAHTLSKSLIKPPIWLVKAVLRLGYSLHLTNTHPSQVAFLQYRPVLDNRRLKEELGFLPEKTSKEVFNFFAEKALGIAPASRKCSLPMGEI